MSTMRDVENTAARLLGLVIAGQQPTGHDASNLHDIHKSVLARLPLLRDGPWTDVILTSDDDYEASDGERITLEGYDPVVTLPTTYEDDCGNTVVQRDLSRVHVIGDGLYVWSSSLASWNKTDDLAVGDTFPFGPEDQPGIAALIAVEAADEYGVQLSPLVIARAEAVVTSMQARFWRGLSATVDPALRARRTWR